MGQKSKTGWKSEIKIKIRLNSKMGLKNKIWWKFEIKWKSKI